MPRSPPPPPSFFNSCARLETIPGGESSPVVVGRSLPSLLLLGGEAPGRVDGQKKEEWRLSATRREGHISSDAIITKFFFSISTCRLFKLRLSFHGFPLSDEPAPVIACSNVRYLEWLSAARRADNANGRGVGEVSWRSLGLWSEVECTTEFVDRMR